MGRLVVRRYGAPGRPEGFHACNRAVLTLPEPHCFLGGAARAEPGR